MINIVVFTVLVSCIQALTPQHILHPLTPTDLEVAVQVGGIPVKTRPGIFCSISFVELDLVQPQLQIILDPIMWERKDWHYNIFSQYGDITDFTYSYPTLGKGLQLTLEYPVHYNSSIEDNPPELIFHHFIPWRYIAAIWSYEQLEIDLIKTILPLNQHYLINKIVRGSNFDSILPLEPDFCYSAIQIIPDGLYLETLHFVQQYAANCGLEEEEILRFPTIDSLVQRVNYFHPPTHPVRYWPPYSD